jgi:hypothetical protein
MAIEEVSCREMWGLMGEGRRVNIRLGIGEAYPESCRASKGYAHEAMVHCEENLSGPVDAELIQCAP